MAACCATRPALGRQLLFSVSVCGRAPELLRWLPLSLGASIPLTQAALASPATPVPAAVRGPLAEGQSLVGLSSRLRTEE